VIFFIFLLNHYIFVAFLAHWKQELSYESIDEESEENIHQSNGPKLMLLQNFQKRNHFSKLGIDKSLHKAFQFLSIGISNYSNLFTDISLIEYIPEFYPFSNSLSLIIQVLSYFPGELRLLGFYFFGILSFVYLNYSQRFILYQIDGVRKFRQSSSSQEGVKFLANLKAVAKNAISLSRNYWENPIEELSYYYEIKSFTDQINFLYLEQIQKWPNNSCLFEDYSYFLIECATDFIDEIKYKYHANLIEEGKLQSNDISFRLFIFAFPDYLKKSIVNMKGHFILERKSLSKYYGFHSKNSSFDEFHDPILISIGRILFSKPQLRIAFQKFLKGKQSVYLNYLKISLIFSFYSELSFSYFMVYFFVHILIHEQEILINSFLLKIFLIII
jgi:hypothetical protein